MSLLETALIYSGQGIPVYAATFYEEETDGIKQLKKPPLYIPSIQESGRYSATIDPVKINAMFSHENAKLIGIPTGSISGIVVIDIDLKDLIGISGEDVISMLEQYGKLPHTLTVETISKGLHLYYKCKEPIIGGVKFFDRKIPVDLLGDGSPGCVYAADWVNYVPEDCDSLENIFDQMTELPEWIKNFKKSNSEIQSIQQNAIVLIPEVVRDIKRKLRYLDPGDYQTWIDTGMELKSTGADRQAYALWREWSEEYHKFSEKEARYKWKSFNPDSISISSLTYDAKSSGYVDYEPSKSMFKIYSAIDLLNPEPEPIWIIEDIISDGSMNVFWGDSGCGKTWVCLDMVICAALGSSWLNKKTIQSNVLIIDEESGKRRLKKRLTKILNGHDGGYDAPFYYMTMARLDVREPLKMEELKFFIKEKNIKLILMDALMEVIPGADENSVKEMNPPLMDIRNLIESTGAAVIIIHHAGKTKEQKNANFRGSSAIKGAVDLMIQIIKDKDTVNLKTSKVRDVEDFEIDAKMIFTDFSFHLDVDIDNYDVKYLISKNDKFFLKYMLDNGICTSEEMEKAASENGMSKTACSNFLKSSEYINRANAGGRGVKASYGIKESFKEIVSNLIYGSIKE